MDFLSTASALLCLLCVAAVAFLSWQTNESATDARDSADELRKTAGVVKANGLSIDTLYGHVKRLDGKIGALQYQIRRQRPPEGDSDEFPAFRDYDPPGSAGGSDRSYAGANQLDPELAAELALQNAPSAAPGSKSGRS